jgi:hypothetical protein
MFATSDFLLASYLLASGLQLHRANGDDPRRVVFHFRGRPERQELLAFAENEATANVHDLARAQKTLKNIIWQARRRGRR